MYETMLGCCGPLPRDPDGLPTLTAISDASSSCTVGEMPVGVSVLLRLLLSDDESRRMKRPARPFFLLIDDRRLLMDRRRGNVAWEKPPFWCVEGGREADLGVIGVGAVVGSTSVDADVRDLRRSLIKSFTMLSEERLGFPSLPPWLRSSDSDRRFSFDIRRS
jgi:hypothetical protein